MNSNTEKIDEKQDGNMNMKKKAVILTYILFFLVISSCNTSMQISINEVPLHKNEQIVRISSLFTPYNHLQLKDCGAPSLVSDVDRVVFCGNKVYVFDDATDIIVCSDLTGRMLATTQKHKGHGKNEYVQLSDMAYDEETGYIYALCDTPPEIMVLDSLLKIIDVIPIKCQPTEMCVLNDCLILLCRDYSSGNFEVLSVSKKNIDNNPSVVLSSPMVNNRVMGMGRCLSVTNGECWVSLPFNRSIYRIDDSEIKEEYRIDFGDNWYKNKHSSKPLDFIEENIDRIWSISNIQKCNECLWFNTNSELLYCLDTNTKECKSYDIIHDSIPFATQLIIPQQGMKDKLSFHIMHGFIRSYLRKSEDHINLRNSQVYILAKENEIERNALIMIWNMK